MVGMILAYIYTEVKWVALCNLKVLFTSLDVHWNWQPDLFQKLLLSWVVSEATVWLFVFNLVSASNVKNPKLLKIVNTVNALLYLYVVKKGLLYSLFVLTEYVRFIYLHFFCEFENPRLPVSHIVLLNWCWCAVLFFFVLHDIGSVTVCLHTPGRFCLLKCSDGCTCNIYF